MAKPDRLMRVLHAMRVMRAPITAARLADEMGVSLRSLYRDIDSLRAAGARIQGERGYGYRLVEDFALRPQTFTRAELEAIALGMAEVKRMGDPVLEAAAISVLAKIAATLPDGGELHLFHAISQVYRPDARFDASPNVDVIRNACWREEALSIRYVDRGQMVTDRVILPLAIIYAERSLTVLAWCCLRDAFRMFRADRISELQSPGKSFRPQRAALLRAYLTELTDLDGDGAASSLSS